MFASLEMELEHQIAEQLRFVEEATSLEEQVKTGSKKLVNLMTGLRNSEANHALLGDEGDGLSQTIHLRVQIDRDKDRIEDSVQANIEDAQEREQVLERYQEAESALTALLEGFNPVKIRWQKFERLLEEAQTEEDRFGHSSRLREESR